MVDYVGPGCHVIRVIEMCVRFRKSFESCVDGRGLVEASVKIMRCEPVMAFGHDTLFVK